MSALAARSTQHPATPTATASSMSGNQRCTNSAVLNTTVQTFKILSIGVKKCKAVAYSAAALTSLQQKHISPPAWGIISMARTKQTAKKSSNLPRKSIGGKSVGFKATKVKQTRSSIEAGKVSPILVFRARLFALQESSNRFATLTCLPFELRYASLLWLSSVAQSTKHASYAYQISRVALLLLHINYQESLCD